MEVIVAKNAGYCFGVKRAIDIATETLTKHSGKIIYSLGEIIHNPQVVDRLLSRGLRVVKSVDDIEKGSVVIISAHGRSERDIEEIKNKDCIIVNATCPYVKLPQGIIKRLSGEGYFIIVLGDRDHPEVKGLISYAKGSNIMVVDENFNGIGSMKSTKVGVVAQTTQNREHFKRLINRVIEQNFDEVRIFNTICDATDIRQEETIEIAKEVDIMVVIGGKNSANTKRLFEISRGYCNRVFHIETAEELKRRDFSGIKRVGVTAGASTPNDIIESVIKRLKSF
ncbi:MAG: 4-hydroxy-3-methylbut-2-enyl diphosphate reductase [Myxococcota bacterium]